MKKLTVSNSTIISGLLFVISLLGVSFSIITANFKLLDFLVPSSALFLLIFIVCLCTYNSNDGEINI